MPDTRKSRALIPQPGSYEAQRAAILQEIEGHDLEDWQTLFGKWIAQNPGLRKQRQREGASALAGREISHADLLDLRTRKAFQALVARERGFYKELNEAREAYISNYPKAGVLFGKSLQVIEAELDSQTGDRMGAVRAATPILQMVADRIHPKKEEKAAVEANVTVNLTVHQAKDLESPEYVVSADEVEVMDVEVLPDEDVM